MRSFHPTAADHACWILFILVCDPTRRLKSCQTVFKLLKYCVPVLVHFIIIFDNYQAKISFGCKSLWQQKKIVESELYLLNHMISSLKFWHFKWKPVFQLIVDKYPNASLLCPFCLTHMISFQKRLSWFKPVLLQGAWFIRHGILPQYLRACLCEWGPSVMYLLDLNSTWSTYEWNDTGTKLPDGKIEQKLY